MRSTKLPYKLKITDNFSGYLAEFFARQLFRLQGYQIIAKNYVTGRGTNAGEIDFIAAKGNLLVFVEVKKRSDLETAAYAVRPKQQQRIRTAAENFVSKHVAYQKYDFRFDAVLVSFPCYFRHIENAF